ncbi:hypothetical protein LCGC14_2040890 [marine sediment metagenome]|uniref:CBS domain-containing protein n=1 Tax=marine sediment metagenome TaxID=412755 RepID=A0A0F9HNZ8_9ZZZZ
MRLGEILEQKGDNRIITIDGNATICQAAAEMTVNNVGALLVTIEKDVEGIITERDLVRLWNRDERERHSPVQRFMSAKLIFASVDDSFEDALSSMSVNNIRHLVVKDGDRISGVISIKDLVRVFCEAKQGT